jgi:hypothetical protein
MGCPLCLFAGDAGQPSASLSPPTGLWAGTRRSPMLENLTGCLTYENVSVILDLRWLIKVFLSDLWLPPRAGQRRYFVVFRIEGAS